MILLLFLNGFILLHDCLIPFKHGRLMQEYFDHVLFQPSDFTQSDSFSNSWEFHTKLPIELIFTCVCVNIGKQGHTVALQLDHMHVLSLAQLGVVKVKVSFWETNLFLHLDLVFLIVLHVHVQVLTARG